MGGTPRLIDRAESTVKQMNGFEPEVDPSMINLTDSSGVVSKSITHRHTTLWHHGQ
jgi:hypothetical protein